MKKGLHQPKLRRLGLTPFFCHFALFSTFDGTGGQAADEQPHAEQEHHNQGNRCDGITRHHLSPVLGIFTFQMKQGNRNNLEFTVPQIKQRPDEAVPLAGRKGGHPGSLVYSTCKGAVITWTRALSNELAPKGIRVNAVAPGLILGTRFHATHTTKESAEETVKGIPLGRAGSPEDVARTILFLASEYDGFITGATIDINGGVYCA